MALADNIIAIIVAAGNGSRAGGTLPKQYRLLHGKPMLRHSYEALLNHPDIAEIIIAIGPGQEDLAKSALTGLRQPYWVSGGATRRESVRNALRLVGNAEPDTPVFIHDAARPHLPADVIGRLKAAISDNIGAIPVLPVADSLARGDGVMRETVDRNGLWRVQTPQAFRYNIICKAHENWSAAQEPTDDARMVMAMGYDVAMVKGDERLNKYTFADDFDGKEGREMKLAVRMGNGFDVHRLVKGQELWLCGVRIEHEYGLAGHSDADVALHALTDAILGAIAAGDIGDHFPPSDARWRGAESGQFVRHALKLATERGFMLGNADISIICEAPRIGPHKNAMRQKLAEICNCEAGQISVKATTTEALGFTGRREGIAAQASVTLVGHQ